MEDQDKKQFEALEVLKPNTKNLTIKDTILENTLSEEAKNQLNKIKEIEQKISKENIVYRTNKYAYNFQHFWTINTFGRDISNGTVTLKEADKNYGDLLVGILTFRKQIKTKI